MPSLTRTLEQLRKERQMLQEENAQLTQRAERAEQALGLASTTLLTVARNNNSSAAAAITFSHHCRDVRSVSTNTTEAQNNSDNPELTMVLPTAQQIGKMESTTLDSIIGQLKAVLALMETQRSEKLLCDVCLQRNKCVIFYPCRHKTACQSCADKVLICPICRTNIQERIVPFE
jgi:hypothetical protein